MRPMHSRSCQPEIKSRLPLVTLLLAGSMLFATDVGPELRSHQQDTITNPLQHDVNVTLKLIQIYVTDKSGLPVRNLAIDEFRVFHNGLPATISAFEKHDLDAKASEVVIHEPQPASKENSLSSPGMGRKFIILFDFVFNTGRGISASIKAARHFIDSEVRPTDELAFMSISMFKGLAIHESITSDYTKIISALDAVSSKESSGRAEDVEQAYWLLANSPNAGGDELARVEMDRRDSMRQAQNYFITLTSLARALRLIQGQKNVLFFSSGVPSSLINSSRGVGTDSVIAQRGSGAARGSRFEVGNFELRPLQETMFREFSASNCSLYAFDTRASSKIPALFDVDELALRTGWSALGAEKSIFRDDKTTGMDSLKSISEHTGGKYYSNISLYEKNLGEVSSITGTYYTLGFPVPYRADGRFNEIKVDVKRKGCHVRTQAGYFNPKPFREYDSIEKNIHLFDLALSEHAEFQTPESFPVSALSYFSGQDSKVRILARLRGGLWKQLTGQAAEIVALFFDERDTLLSLQRVVISPVEFGGKDVLFSSATSALPGRTKCRIVLRDLETGRAAVASTTTFSNPTGSPALLAFSPLLVEEEGTPFLLEGVNKGVAETPPWRAIYGYNPTRLSPIVGDEPIGATKVAVILPYQAPGFGLSDLIFSANLINSRTGENLPMRLESNEPTTQGNGGVQKFAISLETVLNGNYLLYIHVGNKSTGQVASVWVPLTVGR